MTSVVVVAAGGVHRRPEADPAAVTTLADEAVEFAHEWLQVPDSPTGDEPWRFTYEQLDFMSWFYAIDELGRFVYRRAVLRRMKGWGKDPLAAVIAAIEFVGPCRFAGWNSDGSPRAVQHPASWVQVAAVSKDQTRNTMTLFPGLFTRRAIDEWGIDIGKEIIYAERGRRRIEALTTSSRSQEGPRPTFGIENEALALNTVLPTPDGWTTVGAVKVGDRLFGSRGPVTVTKVTPIYDGRPCYRVAFEDGAVLVADEGHLWATRVNGSAAASRVRTTKEMFDDGRRFAVPLVAPLDSPEADLPIDPYLLGYWLGDGASSAAMIAVGAEDLPAFTSEMEGRGFEVSASEGRPGVWAVSVREPGTRRNRNDRKPLGVRGKLVALGLLGNKHIPPLYLRGSVAQRLDLLRGLMDSDGSITAGPSQAIFVNQNQSLAKGVAELARSLGYRVRITPTQDHRWAEPREGWRVIFRADADVNPFLLRRKAEKVSGQRRKWKTVVAIEPAPSVPVRCIEVDSEDHLFVAGDGWTLTHNTEHWRKSNEGHAMHQVMERNIGKSRDGSARLLAVQNAHAPGEDSVAEWDWEAHQLGTPGLLYDSLEGPDVPHLGERAGDGSPLWDGDLLRASLDYARGDSYWVDVGRRAEEIEAPGALANTSRRFYLNQIAAGDERAFDLAVFQALYKERKLPEPGALVTLGFDGSRYGDHTALIATEVSTGYQWVAGYWEPVIVDPVAQPEIPVDDVMETVEFAFETWDVWMLLCDPSWWREQVATWQGRYNQPGQKRVEVINPLQKGRTAQRLLAYRRAMDEGELSHDGDARLQSAIGNAYREQLNSVDEEGEPLWVIQKERPASPLKIDAAAAGELSWWARLQAIAAGVLEVTEPGPAVYVPGWEEEKVRRGGSK